jgi:hypothetical protein
MAIGVWGRVHVGEGDPRADGPKPKRIADRRASATATPARTPPTASDTALAETLRTAAHALEGPSFSQGDVNSQMGIVRAKADSVLRANPLVKRRKVPNAPGDEQ